MNVLDVVSAAIRSYDLEPAKPLLTSTTAANLSVYAGAHLAILRESLARHYPVTHKLLGDDNFRYFARRYGEHHPPRAASVDHFGDRFAEYLGNERQLQRSQPSLAFFAKLDWFHHHPLAPDELELDFPEGLPAAYEQVKSGVSLASASFGLVRRHRLVRKTPPPRCTPGSCG